MQKPRARTGQHGMEGLGAPAGSRVGRLRPSLRGCPGPLELLYLNAADWVASHSRSARCRGSRGPAWKSLGRAVPALQSVGRVLRHPRLCRVLRSVQQGPPLPLPALGWLALLVVLALQLHYSSLCLCHHTSPWSLSCPLRRTPVVLGEVPPHGLITSTKTRSK